MAEKKVVKKEIKEFKTFIELQSLALSNLPNVFIHLSHDTFEFDLVADHYRKEMSKMGEKFEVVVYVSEPGDQDKLFSELFNYSMFSSWKLILVKSGSDFFKPLIAAAKKDYYEGFKRNISGLSEKIYLLVQYDSKELPAKISTLFDNKYSILKTRNFYQEERRKALEDILKLEKVTMDNDVIDDFLHRTPPNSGSYMKSVLKLKNILNKKHFTSEDLNDVLFPTNEFNPFNLVDTIFQNNRSEFYKEFSKIRAHDDSQGYLLSFLSALLARTDEVRKASVLLKRFRTEEEDKEFFRIMKMDSYSDGRKKFVKNRLRRESNLFSPEVLSYIYDSIIDLNVRAKSSPVKDEKNLYFIQKMEGIFHRLGR